MSAFLTQRDQDRAVAYAIQDKDATINDRVNVGNRKTVISRVKANLTDLTVRVAEVMQNDVECYNAKLREVTIVYEGKDKFVTAFPSDYYKIS